MQPSTLNPSHQATSVVKISDGEPIAVAGRVMLWRRMGGLSFGQLRDQSGRVQFSVDKREATTDVSTLSSTIRLGDIVWIAGRMWTTRTGERTVAVEELKVIRRPLRPMPDKWAGLSNEEQRIRKRYLEVLSDDVARERFRTRSEVMKLLRALLAAEEFIEMETPVLQLAASGAAAAPFETYHRALDEHMYLRISPETYLKRAMVGGLDRVYELGRCFRNEGMDRSHLQEFTMLEWYAAHWNYVDNMRLVERLLLSVVRLTHDGDDAIEIDGNRLNFAPPLPVFDYGDLLRDATGVDIDQLRDLEALRQALSGYNEMDDVLAKPSYPAAIDALYKKKVRPGLIDPCFLVHHPVEMVPLARRSASRPGRLEMFQVVVNGWEICKGYSELVDPVEQRERLQEQLTYREAGDDETMMLEEDFIEALEYGLPEMSGVGIGVDRLVALMTNSPSIRDVVYFPTIGRVTPN